MRKLAEEIEDIARDNWDNLILLGKLLEELKLRTSNAGVNAYEIVAKRVSELQARDESSFKWPPTDAPAGQNGFAGDQY